ISGELEISFVKNYCRAGNLSALLKDKDQLPEGLNPFITQLCALYESVEPPPKKVTNSKLLPLSNTILNLLVKRLNEQHLEECIWVTPEKFTSLSETSNIGYAPVIPRAMLYKRVEHKGVWFSQFSESQADSFIKFKSRSHGSHNFGRINTIFLHRRAPHPSNNIFNTWLHVQSFPALGSALSNHDPFFRISMPAIQASLRVWQPTEDIIIRLDEVVAHCSWVMYKSGEINEHLDFPTVALLSMER
ncbi:hypothetical protein DFH28DRAFT_888421, partial [Melampsora americana]